MFLLTRMLRVLTVRESDRERRRVGSDRDSDRPSVSIDPSVPSVSNENG